MKQALNIGYHNMIPVIRLITDKLKNTFPGRQHYLIVSPDYANNLDAACLNVNSSEYTLGVGSCVRNIMGLDVVIVSSSQPVFEIGTQSGNHVIQSLANILCDIAVNAYINEQEKKDGV